MEKHRELMFSFIVKRQLIKSSINIITGALLLRALVSHSFGFVYIWVLGYIMFYSEHVETKL